MTESEGRYGCLSKSLDRFLYTKLEERKEKYGRNLGKYYERVVKSVVKSFQDHRIAFKHLPKKYVDKINFKLEYDNMLSELASHKLVNIPSTALDEAIALLGAIQKEVHYGKYAELANQDFEMVNKWLWRMKRDLNPELDKPF